VTKRPQSQMLHITSSDDERPSNFSASLKPMGKYEKFKMATTTNQASKHSN